MARSAAALAPPARRGAPKPPGHGPRRHGATRPRPASRRRASGPAAATVALPLRVLEAPFTRALRGRAGNVLDALLAGRGWIALVFLLLAGIVFFNVDLLQMNRDIAQNAERVSAFKRENARLRLEAARLGSSERIQEAAAGLGLVLPAPGQVRYLKAHPRRDAGHAAKRITAPVPTTPPAPVTTTPSTPTDPGTATAPTGTTTAPTATTDPTGVTTTTPPAATTPTTPTTSTGIAPTATAPAGTTTPYSTTPTPTGQPAG